MRLTRSWTSPMKPGTKTKEMAGKAADGVKGAANNIGDAVDDAVEKISETAKKTKGS